MKHILSIIVLLIMTASLSGAATVYKYTLNDDGTERAYDEATAAACMQGIINRSKPIVWVNGQRDKKADFWEDVMTRKGHWLEGTKWETLSDLTALRNLAGKKLKGAVIWDPNVPATINVAVTIAGVEDLVVLSPEFADKYLNEWKLTVKQDLRGKFDGSETGSAKNDAYRWAVREYLQKGKCSKNYLFLNSDSFGERQGGSLAYAVTKDWPVCNRGFVFDLSPWGTETPGDDENQPMGTDLATYKMILSAQYAQTKGKQMTELAGFFDFGKYSNSGHGKNHPVGTEWETVYLITPYNVYQNTVDSGCYNKSFQSKFKAPVLKQRINKHPKVKLEKNKTYVCIFMADYDSATPLYDFMQKNWEDKNRGNIPLAWGINPNLINTYPDVITYLYETASKNDYFVADATCAGYFNPTRVLPENMNLFIRHNLKYYKKMDMDISPMVLDMNPATSEVKDAFKKFSPRGYGSMVGDWHGNGSTDPEPHVWKGMPFTTLINAEEPNRIASLIKNGNEPDETAFYIFRIVWRTPTYAIDTINEVKKKLPDYDIEVVDPYTFFDLRKLDLIQKGKSVD